MLRYTLLACVSFTTAYQLSVRAWVRATAARARVPSVHGPARAQTHTALRATPDDATPEDATPAAPAEPVDDALDAVAESVDDTPDAVAEAKDALLQAIAGTDRGFKKDKSMAASVRNAIHALSDAAKDLAPVPLDGDWTLLWTDAPDITSLGSSLPFAPTLGRIGQEISAADGTVVNVIEWRPASLLTTLRSELSEDSVEQRVVTGFTEATPGDVKLVLKGAGLRPRRVLNRDLELGPYDTTGLFSLPFGEFKVLYNDGSLRVVKTGQNFYSVNERYYGK